MSARSQYNDSPSSAGWWPVLSRSWFEAVGGRRRGRGREAAMVGCWGNESWGRYRDRAVQNYSLRPALFRGTLTILVGDTSRNNEQQEEREKMGER